MTIKIRDLFQEDLMTLRPIAQILGQNTLYKDWLYSPYKKAYLAIDIETDSRVRLVVISGKPSKQVLYLSTLYVFPKHRHQGIGTQLLNAA